MRTPHLRHIPGDTDRFDPEVAARTAKTTGVPGKTGTHAVQPPKHSRLAELHRAGESMSMSSSRSCMAPPFNQLRYRLEMAVVTDHSINHPEPLPFVPTRDHAN